MPTTQQTHCPTKSQHLDARSRTARLPWRLGPTWPCPTACCIPSCTYCPPHLHPANVVHQHHVNNLRKASVTACALPCTAIQGVPSKGSSVGELPCATQPNLPPQQPAPAGLAGAMGEFLRPAYAWAP